MEGIPATALIPQAFTDSDKPACYWSPSDLKEGTSLKLFITSEIHAGWKYFTVNREVRLSKEFPKNYKDDIGYKFNHGPGKANKDGQPMEDKAKPRSLWLFRAWIVEQERMVAAVVDSMTLHKRFAKIMADPEYMLLSTGICNFYLTIFREKDPQSPADTYDATGSMRVLRNKKAAKEALKPWFPENYWLGLNPLEPAEEEAPNPGPSLPPTVRDENGADEVVNVNKEEGYEW